MTPLISSGVARLEGNERRNRRGNHMAIRGTIIRGNQDNERPNKRGNQMAIRWQSVGNQRVNQMAIT